MSLNMAMRRLVRQATVGLVLLAALALAPGAEARSMRRMRPRMAASVMGLSRGRQAWEDQYKGFISQAGIQVCGAAYEGYRQLGRGAMFVSNDAETHAPVYGDMAVASQAPVFIPLGRLSSQAVHNKATTDMDEIMRQVISYDPDYEIVVIFEAQECCGVDVLRPKLPPRKLAQAIRCNKVISA